RSRGRRRGRRPGSRTRAIWLRVWAEPGPEWWTWPPRPTWPHRTSPGYRSVSGKVLAFVRARSSMSLAEIRRPSDRDCPQDALGQGQGDQSMSSIARRMFELVEPIGVIPYAADEPNEAMFALGFINYWDTYFAGRAAPLGLVPAEVVDALFYNFAPG